MHALVPRGKPRKGGIKPTRSSRRRNSRIVNDGEHFKRTRTLFEVEVHSATQMCGSWSGWVA